jgi:hypothetical protein
MTLTSSQRVRLKVADAPVRGEQAGVGDGSAVTFALSQRNLTSGSAFVAVGGAWSGTGATFDPTGLVTFATAISANSAFRCTYVYSTFSDDEITDFLDVGGSVIGAAIEVCETLMFDGAKRASWSAPDGSSYDDTSAQAHLRDLHRILLAQQSDEAAAGGSVGSWSLTQGDY